MVEWRAYGKAEFLQERPAGRRSFAGARWGRGETGAGGGTGRGHDGGLIPDMASAGFRRIPPDSAGKFHTIPMFTLAEAPESLLLASTLHTFLHGALSYAFSDSHVDSGLATAR